MNSLQRALIEKAGHDNGFEHAASNDTRIILASARHRAQIEIASERGA